MKFIRRHYLKVTVVLVILIVGYFVVENRFFKADPNVYNPATDTLIQPQIKDIAQTINLAGSVDAANKADLHFQTSGLLSWVGVKVGDRVKKWQTIAALDRKQLQKQLQKSLNDYLTNRSTFEDTQDQYKQTKEKYLLTDEIRRLLDRTQYSLDNTVIAVELNDLAIKYSSIYTPIEGVVVEADPPQAGVNVTPLSASYTIIDPNSVYFQAKIDQADIDKVYLGQTATLQIDSLPDQKVDTTIIYIAFTPVAGETSTVYEIRFALPADNSDLKYRLGMDGEALLTLAQSPNALILPSDAIIVDNDQRYVMVKIDGNRLEKRQVIIGIDNDTDTQIIEGISIADQVVVKK